MFARALMLKERPDQSGPEADLKSDVEAVSSETDGSDEREDPNEYLEDLPAGVRDAELEGGVLPKKNDNTRSAENPSRAAEREIRKAQRGDRSAKRDAPPQSRREGVNSRPEGASRGSGRVPLAEVAKRSRGTSAGANDSAMHIRQASPFASFSEQAGRAKESVPSSRALDKTTSDLQRLRRMSSDTIDARQPKSDLPLMRHTPDDGASRPKEGQDAAVQDTDPADSPAGLASPSDKGGVVKEYRDSLGPMGILGPGYDRNLSPPQPQSGQDAEQGAGSGSHGADANGGLADSSPRADSLPTTSSTARERRMDGKRSSPGARNKRLDGQRRSSASTTSSRAFSRRMSEFAERQPSAEEEALSAICEAPQQSGPAGSAGRRL